MCQTLSQSKRQIQNRNMDPDKCECKIKYHGGVNTLCWLITTAVSPISKYASQDQKQNNAQSLSVCPHQVNQTKRPKAILQWKEFKSVPDL
jgi:hypothetical protein